MVTSPGMRIAVLSDIHANLPALDAVLADAGPVDGIWHLGDVDRYVDEVVDVVRRTLGRPVRGGSRTESPRP